MTFSPPISPSISRRKAQSRWAAGWLLAALLPLSLHAAPAATPSAASLHCAHLVRHLPNLTLPLCEAAKLQPSGALSVGGVPIFQRDVLVQPMADLVSAPLERAQRRRRVLVIGGIHGDELSSSALVFHWIAHAQDTPADMDWRFIPALNPDGLLLPQPTRVNAHGVDLNRNFPTPHWDQEAAKYWVQRTQKDKRRYPGPKALSEPESRLVVDTLASWKPDLIVSIHAPYGVLDYDGPNVPPQRLGRLYLDRVGIFPGSLGHYGGVHKGVPVVTIELPSALRTPTDAEMRQMWVDLLRWVSERLATPDKRAP
jgi:murein peptide amidase A